MFKKFALVAVSALALAGCNDQAGSSGASRDVISAVGSSTVYPFATVVGERFASATGMKTPKIESTGTGGGMERFCAGVGAAHPDIANASRRMKKSEFDKCVANGVKDIVEIQVGIDGIAVGESIDGPKFALTPQDLYKALAAEVEGKPNTAKTWQDVNPALPAVAISVYGPPSTSGTYDAFKELILLKGCEADPKMKAMKDADKDAFEKNCTTLRGAPYYVEQGENDNLMIGKLAKNPNSVGIFGYSYLEENLSKVRGITLGGVAPEYDAIASGKYPGARPLFIYVKKAHIGVIPGIKEYVTEFLKGAADGGYLKEKGLIVSPADVTAKANAAANGMTTLDGAELK
ncbi:MAG: phosphate ABC transporter substrate-binding protein [Sphingomonadales bacterium]|nr:phosphate ABC transporter substrate-binding protein [Sphingomonadales bacterium]